MAGGWAPGSRLESAKSADQRGVSVTPVRDCLYRLAGERMVDFTHGDGFHAHRLSETEYRDMLDLHLILLLAALATTPKADAPTPELQSLMPPSIPVFCPSKNKPPLTYSKPLNIRHPLLHPPHVRLTPPNRSPSTT